MHPHQREYLASVLRRPEWAGLSADAAFAKLERPPKALLAVSFVAQSDYDRRPPKLRHGLVPVPDACAAGFPGGLPGLPNLIRRAWFDAAWLEAGR